MSSHPLNTYSCLLQGFDSFSLNSRSFFLHEWASKSLSFHLSHFFFYISFICTLPTFVVDLISSFCALDFWFMRYGVFFQVSILEFINSIKDLICLLSFINFPLHERSTYFVSFHPLQLFVGFLKDLTFVSCFKNLYLDELSLNPSPFIFRNSCISNSFLCTWPTFHERSTYTLCAFNC